MKIPNIAIACTANSRQPDAEKLVRELNLVTVSPNTTDYPLLLVITESHLELRLTDPKASGPIFVDFLKGALAHRRLFGGGRGQLIARAVGLKNKPKPQVLDLTAGLGRDAFILATLGCDVTMLERNPTIAALLKDGLDRANKADWFRKLKLTLIVDEAKHHLQQLTKNLDVIYLDPMYPIGKKTALVKKEMRILRRLVGADEDAPKLLLLALKHANDRVVVKRPRHALPIAGPNPDLSFGGKSSRFDVYFTRPVY